MQLDRPMGYAYFSDGDTFLEAEILASIFREAWGVSGLAWFGYAELVDQAQRLDSLARICVVTAGRVGRWRALGVLRRPARTVRAPGVQAEPASQL